MLLKVNGLETEIPPESTVRGLLEIKGMKVANVVVELNGSIIKSGQWESTKLVADDKVEIIRFVGGG